MNVFRLLIIALVAWLCVSACGCARMDLNLTHVQQPICMNAPARLHPIVLKHFKFYTGEDYSLFGLLCWDDMDLDSMISREIKRYHGDGVINLKIHGYYSAWQVFPGFIIAPFWLHKTYVVQGDVIALPSNNTSNILKGF